MLEQKIKKLEREVQQAELENKKVHEEHDAFAAAHPKLKTLRELVTRTDESLNTGGGDDGSTPRAKPTGRDRGIEIN